MRIRVKCMCWKTTKIVLTRVCPCVSHGRNSPAMKLKNSNPNELQNINIPLQSLIYRHTLYICTM